MVSTPETYRAYLLRFWRRDRAKPWRVTIQSIAPDQLEHHFASLPEAFEFLQSQVEAGDPPGVSPEDEPDPDPAPSRREGG